jgi:Ca-activated chloride channel family protein
VVRGVPAPVTFETPFTLLGLVVLVPLALVFSHGARAREEALGRFGALAAGSVATAFARPGRRRVAEGLALAGVALCIVALARPQFGSGARSLRRTSGDILFALDLSRSMGAADVAPSRLDAAKGAASTIARAFPDDRVGLVVFGGTGFLQLPPTLDHSTFRTFLDAAQQGDIPDPSTNFEALAGLLARSAAQDGSGAPYTSVVLLSDGEDLEGKLEQAIGLLSSAHVRVFAIGIGAPEGALVMDRDGHGARTPHLDWTGHEVTSRLVEQNLQDIARRTGGSYVRWGGDATARPVISRLAQMRRRAVSSEVHGQMAAQFQWPLALAGVLLLVYPVALRSRSVPS